MRNIELILSYTGHLFFGWQIQPKLPTVQRELNIALARLTGQKALRTIGASRTDTGVHAHDQHVSVQIQNPIPLEKIVYALNRMLPTGIHILSAAERDSEFSARYNARAKHYAYFINLNRHGVAPFISPFVWNDRRPLDQVAMGVAAQHFVGTRSFRALQSSRDHRTQTRTTIHRVAVHRQGDLICFEVIGRHFLYHMVRNMVGGLIKVGRGEWSPEELGQGLDRGDRRDMPKIAPASGLHLFKVFYDEGTYDFSPESARFRDFLTSAP